MKIIAISASLVPSSTANSIQTLKAVQALRQLGHDVTLIVPAHPQSESNWEKLAHLYGLTDAFPIEYITAPSRRLFVVTAIRRARLLKPDLIYTWVLQAAVLGLVLRHPVALELHDLPGGRIGPFWYRYFRDMKGKKRISVITTALKHALDDRYGAFLNPKDVILAPNGVDLERFVDLPDPESARRSLGLPSFPTVACTGHLYQGRGVEMFIELAKRLPGVQFLWAGGRDEDVAHWRSVATGIDNLTFTGFIPNHDLPRYQAAADILLMPYETQIAISSGVGHSAQISSPMKMFEYLASGRAIVSSDLPVFHEALNTQNAVFCPPEDVDAWEQALRALLDDSMRRRALGAQARADAQQYSWVARAKNILHGFLE